MILHLSYVKQERIQDFKLGGAHLKKLRQIFGVFRVKNPDFTPKNHIFSNFRGGARGFDPRWIRPCKTRMREITGCANST
jgi:hypothetical protein